MELADTLLRVTIPEQILASSFEQELETVCAVNNTVPDPLLQRITEASQTDTALQVVRKPILSGWPNDSHQAPPPGSTAILPNQG